MRELQRHPGLRRAPGAARDERSLATREAPLSRRGPRSPNDLFFASLAAMAETIACLSEGRVWLLDGKGHAQGQLASPHRDRAEAREPGHNAAPIVSVTRGRTRGELYYAIRVADGTALCTQTPGSREEERLFLGIDAPIDELDFSFGDEALACTVPGPRGTSAIGSLADDGKGMRTVTEGDVVDCTPRWAPGGRGEILYASAGIGRTRSGAWGGLAPFAIHRLRFSDNSVEVLTADAKYDYLSPVAVSGSLLYALRRPYEAPTAPSPLAAFFRAFRPRSADPGPAAARALEERELVRITDRGIEPIARGVLAFDVATNGDLIYATTSQLFRGAPSGTNGSEPIATLQRVEQLVIC